jgi:peptide/nickel transport system ATP-binding protein
MRQEHARAADSRYRGAYLRDGGARRPVGGYGRLERAKLVQPVFQDPYSSLNPRMRIARIVATPLEVRGVGST